MVKKGRRSFRLRHCTRCFFPVVGCCPPKAPRLINRVTRPSSSSQTKGSLSQNIGGFPPPAAKKYRGFVGLTISPAGWTPIDASSGSGKATSENCVMGSGQTLLIITSTSDVEDAAARMAASDEKFWGSEADFVIELEFSFSMVCFVKYGEEKPYLLR